MIRKKIFEFINVIIIDYQKKLPQMVPQIDLGKLIDPFQVI